MLLYSRTVPTQDHERLLDAAKLAARSSLTHTRYLDWFRTDLQRARVVAPAEVRGHAIRYRRLLQDCRRQMKEEREAREAAEARGAEKDRVFAAVCHDCGGA